MDMFINSAYSVDGMGSSTKYASFIASSDVILFVGSMMSNLLSYMTKLMSVPLKILMN